MQDAIFKYDFHIHTVFSGHSSMDMIVGNIIRKAQKTGLRKIVILEHVPQVSNKIQLKVTNNSYNPQKTIRAQIDSIIEDRAYFKSENPDEEIQIMVGAEIDANPNKMDGSLLLKDLAGIDVVLASTHYLPNAKGMWYDELEWSEEQALQMYDEWFVWAMHIASNKDVNIFAHPGISLCAIKAITEFTGSVLDDFEKLFLICKKFDTAIEINENAISKLTTQQAKTYINIFRIAKDVGVKFSIGSDSHHPRKIGKYKWAKQIIKDIGIKYDDIYQPQLKWKIL